MKACLDASVLASIVFGDPGSKRLQAWLEEIDEPPLVSDFCRGEFVSVVGRKVRSRQLEGASALAMIDRIDAFLAGWEQITTHPDDIADATTMLRNFALGLRLPDAIHVAIARRAGATLITTDHRQRDAARAIGVLVHDPLEDQA